ncbi:hypothetical protein AGMMS49940_24340 [Spirochaetia bacterium]|nr:hypothetical protein AGMMS49940_24340 [Spirochaetia bacterium]
MIRPAPAASRAALRSLGGGGIDCLLTPAETADVAARWALVKALDEGQPQREIAKNLGISLCEITRGSRELKKENSAFRRILEKVKK